jgi:hypothetical protein
MYTCSESEIRRSSYIFMGYCKFKGTKTSPATMSTIPTTEVIIFETSEEFRKDASILRPAFDMVSKSDGFRKCV